MNLRQREAYVATLTGRRRILAQVALDFTASVNNTYAYRHAMLTDCQALVCSEFRTFPTTCLCEEDYLAECFYAMMPREDDPVCAWATEQNVYLHGGYYTLEYEYTPTGVNVCVKEIPAYRTAATQGEARRLAEKAIRRHREGTEEDAPCPSTS